MNTFGLPDYGWHRGLLGALCMSALWFIRPDYRKKTDKYGYVLTWSLRWSWNAGWMLGRHSPTRTP